MPELTEEEYRNLKSLQGTVQNMLKNPKSAVLLEKAHKEIDPKAPTPRLDAEAERLALLEEPNKRVAALEARLEAEETARVKRENDAKIASLAARHEQAFAALRKQRWTEDGIAGLKKMMEEKGIIDVEIAAAAYERLHPPAEPLQQGRIGGFNLFEPASDEDADWKKLLETKGESEPLVDNLARKALNEHRQAMAAA